MLEEWQRQVRAQIPASREQSPLALLDHMPEFLEELARGCEGGPRLVSPAGGAATKHAEQRAAHSTYSLAQVIMEYQVMRQVLLSRLDLASPDLEALLSCFDVAIRIAVESFEAQGAASTSREDTRRQYLEEDLHRTIGGLTDAAAVHERLLQVVTHDLRNPLQTVKLSATLLQQGAPDEDTRRQIVERIARAALGMERMLDDLNVEKLPPIGALLQVKPRPVQPWQLVDDAESALHMNVEARGLHLEYAVEDGLPWVLADPERILQVFSNLVGNAAKFSPPGGRIQLAAHPAEQVGMVAFFVSDTGPGVPPEFAPNIFTAGWRGPDSGGLGLGLAICQNIIAAHGGQLWLADSGRLGGATFVFTLPVALVTSGASPGGEQEDSLSAPSPSVGM